MRGIACSAVLAAIVVSLSAPSRAEEPKAGDANRAPAEVAPSADQPAQPKPDPEAGPKGERPEKVFVGTSFR